MERATAVICGAVGVIVLSLLALIWVAGRQASTTGGIELVAVAARAEVLRPASGPLPDRAGRATSTVGATIAPTARPEASPTASTTTAGPVLAPVRTPSQPSAELLATIREVSEGGVRFEYREADLTPAAQRLLDRLAQLLAAQPNVAVEVRGHADATGPEEGNVRLSQRRADAVAAYLEGRGVPPGQVIAHGMGSAEPVADNATDDGRGANRRSDVVVRSS